MKKEECGEKGKAKWERESAETKGKHSGKGRARRERESIVGSLGGRERERHVGAIRYTFDTLSGSEASAAAHCISPALALLAS